MPSKEQLEPVVVHTNQLYKVAYDQISFQKFYNFKQTIHKDREDGYFVNVRQNSNEKLIIYLGESGSLIKMTPRQALYIGGLGVFSNKEVLSFNLGGGDQINWELVENPIQKNIHEDLTYLMMRYGTLALPYNDKMVIFGGEKGKEVVPSQRDLTNDLLFFNPDTYEIERQ